MQSNLTPLGSKVIGVLIDTFGVKQKSSGLYIIDADGTDNAVKPRWFKITHIGPEQTDVKVGEYVLVAHGRWSRGFNIPGSGDEKFYHLDEEEILIVSDTLPVGS